MIVETVYPYLWPTAGLRRGDLVVAGDEQIGYVVSARKGHIVMSVAEDHPETTRLLRRHALRRRG